MDHYYILFLSNIQNSVIENYYLNSGSSTSGYYSQLFFIGYIF